MNSTTTKPPDITTPEYQTKDDRNVTENPFKIIPVKAKNCIQMPEILQNLNDLRCLRLIIIFALRRKFEYYFCLETALKSFNRSLTTLTNPKNLKRNTAIAKHFTQPNKLNKQIEQVPILCRRNMHDNKQASKAKYAYSESINGKQKNVKTAE